MNQPVQDNLEAMLASAGRSFVYPPTPDLAATMMTRLRRRPRRIIRRLTWATAFLVVILGILFSVPTVRAQIVEFLQIGIVRIFTQPPIPGTPTANPDEPSFLPALATPGLTATPVSSIINLAGETTLAEAQAKVDFPIPLPSYPRDLGMPDYVFLQEERDPMVVLVWLVPDTPDKVDLSLHIYGSGSTFATKWVPEQPVETTVDGQPAVWAEGPYLFRLKNGDLTMDRLIQGHVLVWAVGDITYRLETRLTLDEARKIAESLEPVPGKP